MEPTPAELATIVSVDTLADWCQLSAVAPPIAPPLLAAPPSPRASLLAHLGMTGMENSHFRVVAMLDMATFAAALAGWLYLGAAPSMALIATANLFHVTARRICHLDPWPAAAAAHAAAVAAAGLAAAAPPAIAAPRVTTAVKLAHVVDQTMDAEAAFIPDADVLAMHLRYENIMGEPPTPEAAATEEQLSALHHVLQAGRAPYADFSLFGAHGTRLLRRLRLKGLSLDSAGQFKTVELFGPSDFQLWESSWDVYFTCLIMLSAVQRHTLSRYYRKLKHFVTRFGSAVWHLIYQADVRARSEEWNRQRIKCMADHNRAVARGETTPFDIAMPWDYPLLQLCEDADWWKRELEEPAWMVLTKLSSLNSTVDGDAPISAPATTAHPGGRLPMAERTQPLDSSQPLRVAKPPKNTHRVDDNGLATHNRAGNKLCPDYALGTCQYNSASRCPKGAHQCPRCLSQKSTCPTPASCSAPLRSARASWGAQSKGSGKGKGKGKNRKGK